MGRCGINYWNGLKAILTPWSLPYKMVTGEGLLKYDQEKSQDGMYLIIKIKLVTIKTIFAVLTFITNGIIKPA